MGKILLEKLLRGLPKLKNIYLLIRPKKGKEIQQRLDEFFKLEVILIFQIIFIIWGQNS